MFYPFTIVFFVLFVNLWTAQVCCFFFLFLVFSFICFFVFLTAAVTTVILANTKKLKAPHKDVNTYVVLFGSIFLLVFQCPFFLCCIFLFGSIFLPLFQSPFFLCYILFGSFFVTICLLDSLFLFQLFCSICLLNFIQVPFWYVLEASICELV